MSDVKPQAPTPTFSDLEELLFWLWSSITDAEAYLRASNDRQSILTSDVKQRVLVQRQLRLAQYHLVTSMNSLVRRLPKLVSLFPGIQAAYDNAKHLRDEAKDLRDMIEHADDYLSGGGHKRGQFVRDVEVPGIPGDKPGRVDATSTIISNAGHLLGGRLNVERALDEVKAIWAEAEKIPSPPSASPRRSQPR
jgi:hypothetical protein